MSTLTALRGLTAAGKHHSRLSGALAAGDRRQLEDSRAGLAFELGALERILAPTPAEPAHGPLSVARSELRVLTVRVAVNEPERAERAASTIEAQLHILGQFI